MYPEFRKEITDMKHLQNFNERHFQIGFHKTQGGGISKSNASAQCFERMIMLKCKQVESQYTNTSMLYAFM